MRWTAANQCARLSAASILVILTLACGSSSEPLPPVATVQLSPADDTVLVGETTQLSATLKDASGEILSGRTVTWISGSPAVASVNQTGLVTGVTDGTAIITATSENGTGSASILVFGPCSTAIAPVIAIGQTINGSLATTDCRLMDGTYADGYGIVVTAATSVQIDMTSSSFDTFLYLLEPEGDDWIEWARNDDIDPDDPAIPNDPFDTNSRITFTLQPNVQYFILANSFDQNITGNYQLKVVAAPVVAGSSVIGKPGKAPISSLIKPLKPPK
jgi:hypothetical protein